jgi:ribosome-binding ATPase
MKIGIVGLPNVGKSTLFQALTNKQVEIANYPFATIDQNVGVVTVPDERLQKLAVFSHSEKIVPTIVEFVDIAGLVKGASEGEGLGNKFLTHIREVDAICHVVRAFENDNITHVNGKPNPEEDLATIRTELLLKDMETTEKALEKTKREAKSGDKEAIQKRDALLLIKKTLEEESQKLTEEAEETAQQFGLLSFKPSLVVFNTSSSKNLSLPTTPNSLTLDISQENDVASMTPEEQAELGVQSELPQLITAAYTLLGLITFFTTGVKETHAWTIPKNSTAKRAGRAIHSDFEEKFIRAEVIFWEKLIETTSWANARDKGLVKSEGKEYIVQDGEVIEFKI